MSTKDNANIPVDYQKILDAFNRAADGDYTTEITLSTDDLSPPHFLRFGWA